MRCLLMVISLCLSACSGDETDSPLYQSGYEDGFRAGKRTTCKRIGEFSSSMRSTLATEGIC
jgi:hypothetical protein